MNVILSVDSIFPPLTGIGRYTLELAKHLPTQKGVGEVRFYSRGNWVEDINTLVQVSETAASLRRGLAQSRLAVALYGPLSSAIGRLRLRRYRDFIYHSPNFLLPPFPGLSVATFHDLSMYRHPEFHPPARVQFLRREIPIALERADHLVADSEFIADEIAAHFGFPRASISVAPCGVSSAYHPRNLEETNSILKRYGLEKGGYALCVSTIEPRKNILNLLTAYGTLPFGLRDRYPLVLCGDRGWRSDEIHEAMDKAQRAGWLRYVGYVPEADLPLIYAGARAFVFIPYYEGFGLPALEAMASGVGVVASNRSALPELCGGCARLVDPYDVETIGQAIHVALEDDDWRSEAREAGPRAAEKYTWDNTATKVAEAYRRVLEEKAGR